MRSLTLTLVAALTGCAHASFEAAAADGFVKDVECPKPRVTVVAVATTEPNRGRYVARGCGVERTYNCVRVYGDGSGGNGLGDPAFMCIDRERPESRQPPFE
jgi:hypothetical protein